MSYSALLGEINGSKDTTRSVTQAGAGMSSGAFKSIVPGGTEIDLFNKSKSLASASVTTGSNRDNMNSKEANSKDSTLIAVPHSENESRPSSKKSVTFQHEEKVLASSVNV